jgi:hydroxymethylpyrimidine pyrophosphatase-like HAD family hydrolase
MRYLALCSDYDGTIAHHGAVDDATISALERLVASGRRLVLVTGRVLDDLHRVFPRLELFERVVAENGALLYTPATREERLLVDPPPPALVQALRERAVEPLSVGRCIVATWQPHDQTVLRAIRDLGLELQVIFNKGAVMVLPSGINKATGLAAALESMDLSPRNAVGVGDAENDHAFLTLCECAVAVANALPALKEAADFVTEGDHGAGVAELINEMLEDDLASRAPALGGHRIALGAAAGGRELSLDPYATSVLIAGTSGGGKSTVAKGLIERIAERGYSFCIVDPEGDYDNLPGAMTLGTPQRPPSGDEAMQRLERRENAVINLVGLPMDDRPAFFLGLLPRITALRARTGHPHWLIIDEAHHLLPATLQSAERALPESLGGVAMISVHPDSIAPRAMRSVNAAIVIGNDPGHTLRQIATQIGTAIEARADEPPLEAGEALVWVRDEVAQPLRVRTLPSRIEHRRHNRKYAEGELPPDRSFYFRGPEEKLNLRARNLFMFLQMADGVDDDTWRHHLRRGDYSRWFAEGIKDESLSVEASRIEQMHDVPAQRTRALVREAIEREYTLPA